MRFLIICSQPDPLALTTLGALDLSILVGFLDTYLLCTTVVALTICLQAFTNNKFDSLACLHVIHSIGC